MDFVSLKGYESPHMTQFCSPHTRIFAGRIDTSGHARMTWKMRETEANTYRAKAPGM
jgi:hypothetical protein